jgi:hypothetical protein
MTHLLRQIECDEKAYSGTRRGSTRRLAGLLAIPEPFGGCAATTSPAQEEFHEPKAQLQSTLNGREVFLPIGKLPQAIFAG